MTQQGAYSFGEFSLHPSRRVLARAGAAVELGSRAMDVLIALVRRHGSVATKSDIMAEVWPGVVVEENNLTTQIAAVRRALGDGNPTRYIQTVPGRGYRFVADVRAAEPDPAPAPAFGRAAPAPHAVPEPDRHNLPAEFTSFIGRERELGELQARLRERPLVTLVGAGGVGKTRAALRLAAAMAADFPDGVLLLELAALTERSLVAETLCRLLGAPVTGERPAEDIALAVLRRKRMLLLIDNCEHVLAAAASLAAGITRLCPEMRVLATSREALGIAGEAVYVLPSLDVPAAGGVVTAAMALRSEAVRLFTERAADALGGYVLTDADAPAVVSICRRLDGVPLATELAAARLRMLKPAELAARLEDVFRLLTTGRTGALPRQQTLRATIEWSYSLLSGAQQTVLRRLSVFIDGCTLDGATSVAAGEDIAADDVFDMVASLVSKSLLVADRSGAATRYRMLESTRQYAYEKLCAAGEQHRHEAMARHLLARVSAAEASWPVTPTDIWLADIGPELRNFRAAVDWAFGPGGAPGLGIALVARSGVLADEMSLQPDLMRWTAAALSHLDAAPSRNDAAWALFLSTMNVKRLGTQQVPPERAQAIALFRETGDALGLNRALRQTAIAQAEPGRDNAEPLAMLREAAQLLRGRGPHKDLAATLAHTGSVHFVDGDCTAARELNETALAMRRRLGDRSGTLASIANLAELCALEGDIETALRYAREAESEARGCNAVATLAVILVNLASYCLLLGDHDAAERAALEGLSVSRAIGHAHVAVVCLDHLAMVLGLKGAHERAAKLAGFTTAFYEDSQQVREFLEAGEHARLMEILRGALPPFRLARLLAEGRDYDAEIADAVALGGAAAAVTLV